VGYLDTVRVGWELKELAGGCQSQPAWIRRMMDPARIIWMHRLDLTTAFHARSRRGAGICTMHSWNGVGLMQNTRFEVLSCKPAMEISVPTSINFG
jgi:hypothetical protein